MFEAVSSGSLSTTSYRRRRATELPIPLVVREGWIEA
jgi:hypothetical protein